MKRALAVALVVVLAFLGVACSDDDDGGDGGGGNADGGERTGQTRPEDPRSALIADEALLSSSDLPPWWSETDSDPEIIEAMLASNPACDDLTAAQLTSGANENARSGPVSFLEVDGLRRLDVEISLYPDEEDAQAFLDDLEKSDAPGCLNALLADVVPGGVQEPAAWGTPPPLGDQSLTIVFNAKANDVLPEDLTVDYIWVRVGRAVAQLIHTGPVADDPTEYIETVTNRLSEGLADD